MNATQPLLKSYKKHIHAVWMHFLRRCVQLAHRIEVPMEQVVGRLPALPHDVQLAIAKLLPYLAILVLAVEFVVMISVFGGFVFYLFTMQSERIGFAARLLVTAMGCVCLWEAIKSLFAVSHRGWLSTYYAYLLFVAAMLLHGAWWNALAVFVVVGYVLMQVKHVYRR